MRLAALDPKSSEIWAHINTETHDKISFRPTSGELGRGEHATSDSINPFRGFVNLLAGDRWFEQGQGFADLASC